MKSVMIMHMNDILNVMIMMDIIPHCNYFILFYYRGVLWSVSRSESICI